MRQFTSDEIQAQFERIPVELQEIMTSPEIQIKVEKIGKDHALMIDQLGELVDEIGLIILGLIKSADFVPRISNKLGISSKTAFTIAQDVNKEIFDSIKDYIKKIEMESDTEEINSMISSVERVGDFHIEPFSTPREINNVTHGDRGKILNSLENPPKNPDHNFSEPLVDHLLQNTSGKSEHKVSEPPVNLPTEEKITSAEQTAPVNPQNPMPEKKSEVRKGPDPYREQVE